ncbi:MAG: ABC-F type ribosomal protection protein [Clostridiales bacterium]|jgi:lincosamide and streptogramin A transport system ATP-binding/permease protein|nr:ABC-F type ribosomal protection protein [Clostridiales bacterium]
MSIIEISRLTFGYDGSFENVFEDVSLNLDADWRLGLCGRNGRGKTTFLKLLAGCYEYKGRISASVGFEYFPYAVEDGSRAVASVMREIAPNAPDWLIKRELSKLDVGAETLDRPFFTLSNGERVKCLLAAMFVKDNGFLLIDEPTNHLDAEARRLVAKYLHGKKGFVLVSHDRAFLDACVEKILSINKSGIEIADGNFSEWYRNKLMKDAFEEAQNAKLEKEIEKLSAAARRVSDWADKTEKGKYGVQPSGLKADRGYIGHKSAKLMKRSKAIEYRLETAADEKRGLLKDIESADALKILPLKYHGERLVSLDKAAISYDGRIVCGNVTFDINQGDRIALVGKNGSGKSSVLKLILGRPIEYDGAVRVGSGLKISYVPQDVSGISGSLDDFAAENAIDKTLFKTVLRKLDFSRGQLEKDISEYSAGQKKKTAIAASLCRNAHLYVWDEPLNYVDIFSRMQVEELLREYRPTLLFVEHDRAFCENIATKTVGL